MSCRSPVDGTLSRSINLFDVKTEKPLSLFKKKIQNKMFCIFKQSINSFPLNLVSTVILYLLFLTYCCHIQLYHYYHYSWMSPTFGTSTCIRSFYWFAFYSSLKSDSSFLIKPYTLFNLYKRYSITNCTCSILCLFCRASDNIFCIDKIQYFVISTWWDCRFLLL